MKQLIVITLMSIILAGCDYPVIHKAEFNPKCPCTGETSVFSWETEDINKFELRDGGNEVRLTTEYPVDGVSYSPSSGSWTTPELTRHVPLPFRARGKAGGEWGDFETAHLLIITDNPKEEEFISNDLDATEDYQNGDEKWVDGVLYKQILLVIKGYIWRIPYSDFDDRVRVNKVTNIHTNDGIDNDDDLYIKAGTIRNIVNGVDKGLLVRSGGTLEIETPFHPGVDWYGMLKNTEKFEVAYPRIEQCGKDYNGIRVTPGKRSLDLHLYCLPE